MLKAKLSVSQMTIEVNGVTVKHLENYQVNTMLPKATNSSEHDEQVKFFDWANALSTTYPCLGMMFAIPNGGHRNVVVALKLKREGVKPGVLDIFLPYPKDGKHGLFIEMKYGKNRCTKEQNDFRNAVGAVGYAVAIGYSWQEAAQAVIDYLKLPLTLEEA